MFNPTPKYCTYHPVNAGVIDPSHEFQTELLDISGITEKQNYFDKAQKSINGGDFMPLATVNPIKQNGNETPKIELERELTGFSVGACLELSECVRLRIQPRIDHLPLKTWFRFRTCLQWLLFKNPGLVGVELIGSSLLLAFLTLIVLKLLVLREASGCAEPWIVIGDFNATLSTEDRNGCAPSSLLEPGFQKMVFDSGLSDLDYVGLDFTWYRGNCSVRLDRCNGNAIWFERYPDSCLHYLLRMKSDHKPILLSFSGSSHHLHNKPFRYLFAWALHHDFDRLVHDSWDSSLPITDAIQSFTIVA
ncbi:hypothetical protein V6N13_129302 [Hibiscus sabdariffa]